MLKTAFLAVALATAVRVLWGGEVTYERPMWTFDAKRVDYSSNAAIGWKGDDIVLSGTTHAPYVRHPYVGAKPVRGIRELIVEGECVRRGAMVAQFRSLVESEKGAPIRVKAPFDGKTARFDVSGKFAANGSYRLEVLQFWPAKERKDDPFEWRISRVAAKLTRPVAEAIELDVETSTIAHVWREGDPKPVLRFANPTGADVTLKAKVALRDFYGEGPDVVWEGVVPTNGSADVALPDGLAKGIWRVRGELAAADGTTATAETTFGVIDRHEVTPRWKLGERYRFGINWHGGRFSKSGRHDTEDVLGLIGCKLVRTGGFNCSAIQSEEGRFDWAEADEFMDELVSRGISCDTGLYGFPKWALKDVAKYEASKDPKRYQMPPRDGVMRDWAKAVAAHYGTKIDYYELGNEWDLVRPEILPEDEAVRVHVEAWQGLKVGCPAAKMMSNGWTGDMTFDRPGMDRRGFQERYMRTTAGMHDFHPIHMHSRIASYAEGVQRFLAQRKALGMEKVPWFSNETALTTVNGMEPDATRHTWMKPLYAWAHGSHDYIWYNLKGTGWDPADSEQAYGLLTADFHPRATFCAYSALIAIAQGLSFDRILVERNRRFVYRLCGEKFGFRGLVIAGWDENAGTNERRIRVKTDAKRAIAADLFNRRTELPIVRGEVVWGIRKNPGALVLEGATRAEPVPDDLENVPDAESAVIEVQPTSAAARPPDLVLDRSEFVHGLFDADPATRDRVWGGAGDCSARLWFDRVGGRLRLVADVTDEKSAAGDRVVAFVNGREITLCRNGSRWEATVDAPDVFDFDLKVEDDDGKGVDGWLRLSETSSAPRKVKMLPKGESAIPALQPVKGSDPYLETWHGIKLREAKTGGAPVAFVGSGAVYGWECEGARVWHENFASGDFHALNLGFRGERTENILWRLKNGELDGFEAKCVVVLAGRENFRRGDCVADALLGVKAIVDEVRRRQPRATVVLCPSRAPWEPYENRTSALDRELENLCDGEKIMWCGWGLVARTDGYASLADALRPYFRLATEVPPAARAVSCVKRVTGKDPQWWIRRLRRNREEICSSGGTIDLVLVGDSITHGWEGKGKESYAKLKEECSVLNCGYSADRTQHAIWRLGNGELDGYEAKGIVIMIGTNNDNTPEEIRDGVAALIELCRRKQPRARILLLGIFPRGHLPTDKWGDKPRLTNPLLERLAGERGVEYLDFGRRFQEPDGTISKEMMGDFLHPEAKGYVIWREEILPFVKKVCGK